MIRPVQIYQRALAKLPRVPSRTPVYKTTVTTTVDETTSTFTGLDIGTPHPKRIVIIAGNAGVSVVVSGTINGIPLFFATPVGNAFVAAASVPVGTVGDLALSATGSLRKAVSVFVAYPNSHVPLDSGISANVGSGAGPATFSDLKVQSGGFVIYAASGAAALGVLTTTWSGADAVAEDITALYEATTTVTSGRIHVTASSDADDLTVTPAVDVGAKRIATASWGPPPP